MNPTDPIDRAVLRVIATLAADLASLRKVQLETTELMLLHLTSIPDGKKLGLLSELEQGLAASQSLAESVVKLKQSLGL